MSDQPGGDDTASAPALAGGTGGTEDEHACASPSPGSGDPRGLAPPRSGDTVRGSGRDDGSVLSTPPVSAKPPAVSPTRLGSLWLAVALGLALLVVVIVFIVENPQHANVSFFGAHRTLPLGVDLLLAAVLGARSWGVAVPLTQRTASHANTTRLVSQAALSWISGDPGLKLGSLSIQGSQVTVEVIGAAAPPSSGPLLHPLKGILGPGAAITFVLTATMIRCRRGKVIESGQGLLPRYVGCVGGR